MTKKPTVTTLQSGFNSTETLNSNFEKLRDAFDNTLSLDGSTPNSMEADLDLNGNSIIGATGLLINGTDYLADVEAAKAAALVAQAAAELAENNAETAEVNAEASETAAANSATSSASSASAASVSATAAQTAQTAAELAETNAETAETNAETAETNAQASALAALASEIAAAASEVGVEANRVTAEAAATAAAASETAAATSETNAATSEANSANSATASASSATASAASATAASASETAAAASETAAATSETNAATSATNAATSVTTATTKASEASASATAAASSASASATSATDSASARDQSQDARDTANLHKLAAETAATSATNTAAALTGFDLEAIAESKAVTAVDVFVYDTSKDSDGGAWRKRTQGTSWYNETLNTATRGSRQEFPAVAVIVAEAGKVTIYDGDDPSLPMWMVFNPDNGPYALGWWESAPAKSVTALNGVLSIALDGSVTETGLLIANFPSGNRERRTSNSGYGGYGQTLVSGGDAVGLPYRWSPTDLIVNAYCNDIAMTVLPNAPIDAATGLPVPTIAVATDGGVSVITDSGAVYDSASTADADSISFTDDNGLLFALHSAASNSSLYLAASDVFTSDGWAATTIGGNTGLNGFPLLGTTANDSLFSEGLSQMAQAGGLSRILWDSTENQSLLNYTTSTYNTGWMNGDIKGAFLSDTDDTDLVGTELVTGDNSTFTSGTGDWAAIDPSNTTITNPSGEMYVVSTASYEGVTLSVPTVVGQAYILTRTVRGGTGTLRFRTLINGVDQGGTGAIDNGTGSTQSFTYVATSTSTVIRFQSWNTIADFYIDDVTFKLAGADRSVNNNGLIVNGTVTRSPVATGADLVAYSGFSASNYLEQPYNSDLDFGTGDFCVMGWFKGTGNGYIFSRTDASQNDGFALFLSSGKPYLRCIEGGLQANGVSTTSIASDTWRYFCALRKDSGTSFEIYVDGGLSDSFSVASRDVNGTNNSVVVGNRNDFSFACGGSLALIRISATAPTAEQIAKIYEDEKALFQENAQATLYGTSDAVTALAHDDATNLLHVGTSAGRSVFQGLRRVENTTTAVGTAISASNGLVVEE